MTEITNNFTKLNERLDNYEAKLEKKYFELEKNFEGKFETVNQRFLELKKFKADFEKAAVMQESYQKRMNILVHGIEEDQECAWETRKKTAEKFDHFLYDAHKMDPDDVEIEEIHRLPQRPVIKDGKKVIRPIIVKLANATTKHNIFGNLKRLKTYNIAKKLEGKPLLFVTDHLPKNFLEQKKIVNASFYSSKKNQQKTSWRAENNEYALYVNLRKIPHQEIILLKIDCPIDRLPDL